LQDSNFGIRREAARKSGIGIDALGSA